MRRSSATPARGTASTTRNVADGKEAFVAYYAGIDIFRCDENGLPALV